MSFILVMIYLWEFKIVKIIIEFVGIICTMVDKPVCIVEIE